MSSTATLTPRPPGRPTALRRSHASGALTPKSLLKFHCTPCQPPNGLPGWPGSFGTKPLMWAITFGDALSTPGRRSSSAIVCATLSPSRILSTRVRGAKTCGCPVPVERCAEARTVRLADGA